MIGFLVEVFLRFLFVFRSFVQKFILIGFLVEVFFEVFVLFVFRSFVQKFFLIGFLVEVFLSCFVCFKVFRPEVYFGLGCWSRFSGGSPEVDFVGFVQVALVGFYSSHLGFVGPFDPGVFIQKPDRVGSQNLRLSLRKPEVWSCG